MIRTRRKSRRRARWAAGRIALALALLLVPGCTSEEPEDAAPPPSGAVSSGTPEATEAGLRVLALGGNAIDAAVAVSLALGATEPSESGLGGTAVMLIAPADGEPVLLHATPEALGASGTAARLLRPTTLPVLVHAWRRYGSGRVSWEQLVEPARLAAERGYTLGRFRHRMIVSEYRQLLEDSVARALLLNPDRSIPGEGTVMRHPALAAALERLAGTAEDDLPAGDIAAALRADVAERIDSGAAAALATPVTVREDRPMAGVYRGWTVLVPGAPYAGAAVLRGLEFLEGAPVEVLRKQDEVRAAWLSEALGYAMDPAAPALAGYVPTLPPLPVAMDSGGYRAPPARAPGTRTGAPAPQTPAADPAAPPPAPDPAPDTAATGTETSHFSVVDGEGNAVSVTQSLGGPFGARATGLGVVIGRAPRQAAAAPPESAADSTAAVAASLDEAADPWEEPVSWAVPTILVREGVVGLVLGSAGGPRAVSAVVQVITDWVDGGQTLERAVAAPRLHIDHDGLPRPRMALEGVIWINVPPGGDDALAPWGRSVREMAAQRGIRLGEWVTGLEYLGTSPYFGGVNAVAREGQSWTGAADPRRDGDGRPLTDEDILRARSDPAEEEEEEEPALPPVRPNSEGPE